MVLELIWEGLLSLRWSNHYIKGARYDSQRFVFPAVAPATDQQAAKSAYSTANSNHNLDIALSGEPCGDSMSGESFSTTVFLTFDGERLRGCGTPLH